MKKAQAAIEKVLTVSQAQHIDWTQSVVDLSFDQQTPVDEAWQDLRREGMIK
jgi:hypothetical protein